MAQDYAKGFYSSRAWKETQAAYMESQHRVCERCESVARIVHHKRYISPQNINDPNITLNWNNLEALCHSCHEFEHKGTAAHASEVRFNSNGDIVKV